MKIFKIGRNATTTTSCSFREQSRLAGSCRAPGL